jgi:hypothetical protein
MVTHTVPSEIPSDAAIELKIGGMFQPEWQERSIVAPAASSIEDARRKVKSVAIAAKRIADATQANPQSAPLHLAGLARAGANAITALQEGDRTAGAHLSALGSIEQQFRNEVFPVRDASMAMQVRDALLRTSEADRMARLREHMQDRDVVAAVLWAPPLASGLSAEQHAAFREAAEMHHVAELVETRNIVGRAFAEAQRSRKMAVELIAGMAGLTRGTDGRYRAPWEVSLDT